MRPKLGYSVTKPWFNHNPPNPRRTWNHGGSRTFQVLVLEIISPAGGALPSKGDTTRTTRHHVHHQERMIKAGVD